MKREIDPKITKFLSAIGKKGGRNRAKSHSRQELSSWASRGGRPTVLTEAKLKRLQELRRKGHTLESISDKLKVSVATIGRAVKRLEGTGHEETKSS